LYCKIGKYDPKMPRGTEKVLDELKTWCFENHGRQVVRYLNLPRQALANWFGERNWPIGEQVLVIQGFLAKQKGEKSP
jgi:hypothetical protein